MRCFFDPGSQTSFVRQSVVHDLGLDLKSIRIVVSEFRGEPTEITFRTSIAFTVAPVNKPGEPQCIEALTAPAICRAVEAVDVHPARWFPLRDIKFREDFLRGEMEIDVLIGLDLYYSFVTRDIVKVGSSEPFTNRT